MDEKITKAAYYLLISGMQKAIRFGMPEVAVNLARVAHSIEPFRLFKRLWTVLFEDCGLNRSAMDKFQVSTLSYKKFDEMIPMIREMASGVKSRDSIGAAAFAKGGSVPTEAVMEVLSANDCTDLPELAKIWDEDEKSVQDMYRPEDLVLEEPQRLLNFVERGVKMDYECGGVAVPWFFTKKHYKPELSVKDETVNTELYCGFYPMAAIDEHTWPGKMVLAALKKRVEMPEVVEQGNTEMWLEWCMFYYEGSVHKRELKYPVPLCDLALASDGYGWLMSADVRDWFVGLMPKITELRRWAITKHDEVFEWMREEVSSGH